ncbi:unnamed protein product [Durusdinium trenchii]|uniref:Uncharacterized protein n=1 Tax=Durusdinium trenchii TaxID=1381693 RepID=A0ABP0KJU6_9DINO
MSPLLDSPRACPPMQELGLSPHLMQAIRNLYRRRQLLRPVRQLRATAAGCLAGARDISREILA